MSKKELYQNELGIWLEREVQFEKREKMTRREWAIFYDLEEIDEATYVKECRENQYMLNRNLS
jgi:hypothetical protein